MTISRPSSRDQLFVLIRYSSSLLKMFDSEFLNILPNLLDKPINIKLTSYNLAQSFRWITL